MHTQTTFPLLGLLLEPESSFIQQFPLISLLKASPADVVICLPSTLEHTDPESGYLNLLFTFL